MTEEELVEAFKHFHDEFLKFERVVNKRSRRSDLHAFLLLDELVLGDVDMIAVAVHDEIFIDVTIKNLAPVVTREQILELVRCGVRLGEYGFAMFA